jgi:hypothetical protein
MIEIEFMTLVFWWIVLSLFSIGLILLRDDAHIFYNDIKCSVRDGFFQALTFVVAYIFYAPMTLPYSITYFLEKWKKN